MPDRRQTHATTPRARGDLPHAIDSTVASIAQGFADRTTPLSLTALLDLIGDLEEGLLGQRQPSRTIARQISLWFTHLPREVATALTARALAERTRFLLHAA